MEIRINKEIKDYHESVFFGLNARQFICSACAVGTAVGVYFSLRNYVGKEFVSWLCIICAAPFAATGFFEYNGMNFEKFVIAYIRSNFLCAGKRVFKSENILYNLYKEVLNDAKKADKKKKKKKNTENCSAVDSD